MASVIIKGEGCFQEAQRKARLGHKDWVVYRTPEGSIAERKSPESVKRALLASGTQGRWILICAGDAPMAGFWWLGLNLLRQMRMGVY